MQKSLRSKDSDIAILIQLGLYQMLEMSIPDHAAVQQTVRVALIRRKQWARGLVNAVLRRFQREKEDLLAEICRSDVARFSHPDWIVNRLRSDWPDHWQEICEAANARPPMTLRINRRSISRENYLAVLADEGIVASGHPQVDAAVVLDQARNVSGLPGFSGGQLSVQDAGAQLAASLLAPNAGDRVLDACAAPGGKTCHLLESVGDLEMTALDSDAGRCERIRENLVRLKLDANVVSADAACPEDWWDGRYFDAILLDVPCSALGVIRRHPDIKALRREEDIRGLLEQQRRILEATWPLLKPKGRLLYATCSVTKAENSDQIVRFVNSHPDANSIKIDAEWGIADTHGRQILTGQHGMDGFYYALLEKTA